MHQRHWFATLGLLALCTPGIAYGQPEDPVPPPSEAGETTPDAQPGDEPPADAQPEEGEPSAEGTTTDTPAPDTAARPVTQPVVTPEPAPAPGPVAMPPAPPPPPATPPKKESPGIFEDYTGWYDAWLERVLSKPLWGQTAQLPEGLFKVRYNYSYARADKFYSRDGDELPLLPDIVLNDCSANSDPNCQVQVIQPHVEGRGYTHEFQLAFGITDALDVWVEIPFQVVNSTMDLRLMVDGQPAGPVAFGALETTLEQNGRPLPNERYDGNMDLGDIRIGTSWNFYRTEYFSTAITPSVYLPTGKMAEANNDLTFLRGTEIDRGTGAWGVAFTNVIDVRPIDWFILNFEVTPRYRFGYDRKAPTWLPITSCKRLENAADRSAAGCSDSVPYDPVYDMQQSGTFPDLEGLDDTYYVYPNMSLYFMAGFTVEVVHIPFQFGWAFERKEATTIKATGDGNSGANFEQLVRSLALLEATETHVLSVGVQIPLLPLYIPMMITPTYRRTVAGRNTIKLADQYGVAFELFLPAGEAF